MNANRIIYALVCVLLFAACKSEARIFYVDVLYGSDDNDGKTVSTAWKTILRVNNQDLKSGDSVLFKAGHKWNARIRANNSGTNEGYIVYGKYGEGVNPLIDIQYKDGAAFYTSQSYIRIENIDFSNTRNNALVFINSHYIEIENVNVRFAEREPGTVTPDDFSKIGNNGIAFIDGGSNIYINNVMIAYAPNNGILFRGHATNHISEVTVKNSYIHHALLNDGLTIHRDCCGGTAGKDFLVENNKVEYCWEQGIDIDTGSFVKLINNISNENGEGGIKVGYSAEDISIISHKSTNEPVKHKSAAVALSGNRVSLTKSRINGKGHHLIAVVGLKNTPTRDVIINGNEFLWNGGSSIMDITGPVDNLTVINNRFQSVSGNYINGGMKQRVIRFRSSTRPPNYKTFRFEDNQYSSDAIFQLAGENNAQKSFNLSKFRSVYGQEKKR